MTEIIAVYRAIMNLPTIEDYYVLSDAFTDLAQHFELSPDDVRAHRATMEGDEVPNAAALVDWIKKNTTRI